MPSVFDVMNTAVPCTRGSWVRADVLEEQLDRASCPSAIDFDSSRAAALPRRHHENTTAADREREPAARRDLDDVRDEERQIDHDERA